MRIEAQVGPIRPKPLRRKKQIPTPRVGIACAQMEPKRLNIGQTYSGPPRGPAPNILRSEHQLARPVLTISASKGRKVGRNQRTKQTKSGLPENQLGS